MPPRTCFDAEESMGLGGGKHHTYITTSILYPDRIGKECGSSFDSGVV